MNYTHTHIFYYGLFEIIKGVDGGIFPRIKLNSNNTNYLLLR